MIHPGDVNRVLDWLDAVPGISREERGLLASLILGIARDHNDDELGYRASLLAAQLISGSVVLAAARDNQSNVHSWLDEGRAIGEMLCHAIPAGATRGSVLLALAALAESVGSRDAP